MLLTGQCLCGSVKYESDAEPESMKYCHCDTCRKVTGSAFNIGVGIPKESLKVIGEVRTYTHINGVARVFCPTCGTPLWTVGNRSVWIRAGTIDDTEGLYPTAEMWTDLAVPWAHIPKEIPSYPQAKPSLD